MTKSYYQQNKEHVKEYMRQYHARNRAKRNLRMREVMLKRRYNLTQNDYLNLIKNQMGRCAICSGVFSNKNRPEVDHCHLTGKVRGILCTFCNSMLGYAKDRIDVLQKATVYLNYSNSDIFTVVDGCLKFRQEGTVC
jgi:hypothetical protein